MEIYQEYSEDELKDLIVSLSGVGHKHRLVQGEDFGFGPDLKGQNDGKTILFLTLWALDQLSKTDLVYRSDKTELTWPRWSEYKGTPYEDGIPVPRLKKVEDLTSLDFPPRMGFFVGTRESIVDNDLWFFSLSVTRTGRNFPLNTFNSRSMYISSKKVVRAYDIIVNKLKTVNI